MVNLVITNSYTYEGDLIRGFVPLNFFTPFFFDDTTKYYVFAKDYPKAGRSKLPHPLIGGIKESVIATGKVYKVCTECPPSGNIIAFMLKDSKRITVFPKMGVATAVSVTPSPQGGLEVVIKVSAKSLFYLLHHDGIEGEAFLVSWNGFGLTGKMEVQALG